MHKLVLFVVIAVFVSACRSAESIPAGSKLSDDVVDQKPNRNGKSRLQLNEQAAEDSNDERVRLPPDVESSIASSSRKRMRVEDHLPAQLVAPHKPEVSHVTNNEKFKALIANLGINMDGAKSVASILKSQPLCKKYDMYSLELMVLGSYILKQIEIPVKYYGMIFNHHEMHNRMASKETDRNLYHTWREQRRNSAVLFRPLQEKMFWLYKKLEEKGIKMRIDELADMVFGNELFELKKTDLYPSMVTPQQGVPTPPTKKVPEPGQHNHGIEYELDSDPRVVKRLQTLAKDTSGQNQEELQKKVRHAIVGDLLTEETKKERK